MEGYGVLIVVAPAGGGNAGCLTSDCGLFAYSRPAARAKLSNMVRGAALAHKELAPVPA